MTTELVDQSLKEPFLTAILLVGSTVALTRPAAFLQAREDRERAAHPRGLAPLTSASRPTHARAARACTPGSRRRGLLLFAGRARCSRLLLGSAGDAAASG